MDYRQLMPARVPLTKSETKLKGDGNDGLGSELRIFNLTQQKRSEAQVDLGDHFKNMSK